MLDVAFWCPGLCFLHHGMQWDFLGDLYSFLFFLFSLATYLQRIITYLDTMGLETFFLNWKRASCSVRQSGSYVPYSWQNTHQCAHVCVLEKGQRTHVHMCTFILCARTAWNNQIR